MQRKVFHVIWTEKNWKVKEAGVTKAVIVEDTKVEAVNKARKIAKNNKYPAQIRVHKKNGTIEFENTYKNDPEKYQS